MEQSDRGRERPAVSRHVCGRFTQRFTWREVHGYLGLIGLPRNPSTDGVAQRSGFATIRHSTSFQGLLRCETVLQCRFDWRYLYPMLIGYARVSTEDQDTTAQVAALKEAGRCTRWVVLLPTP